ncbi:MAG: site-specific integrase, partial [Thaumarchaeota archaeon]|nr:site-specific integrase [Nitrososphaerota archaeon]
MPVGRKLKDRSVLAGEAIKPFRDAVRSEVTLGAYERRLVQFFDHYNLTVDTFVTKAKADSEWAQKLILDYMLLHKARVAKGELSASTLPNLKKPIRLLLTMNDVTAINWEKITRLMPKQRKYALDRAPSIEEIRLLSSNSDLRFKAIIMTMLSSGIRVGAWNELDWGHIKPILRKEKIVAAKLTVYAGDPEEYISFMTPEAYSLLQQYIQLRESHGEKIDGSSPVIRDRFQPLPRGSYTGDINKPVRLATTGVSRLIENTFWKMGLRKEKRKRHEFSIHSFRKFFKTRAEQVMRPINVETLMGHSTGLSDSYY